MRRRAGFRNLRETGAWHCLAVGLCSARERESRDRGGENLLQASGTSHEGVGDPSSREVIRVIGAMCARLPLALKVAGTSVQYMKQHQSGDVSKI